MKSLVVILWCTLSALFSFSQTVYTHPALDDEFIGPFPSWLNVKAYGAVGDGKADETAAIQAAFNAIGNSTSTSSVVYLPAGTYRITGTLRINNKINISVIGQDPATTRIVWAGARGGTMLELNGTAYSRFNRITWNGSGIAAVAVDQSYDNLKPYFDTGNEYADDFFTDVGTGIRGGHKGYGFAEVAILRCRFIRNTVAGISLGNFNALDIWVWYCVFQDCTIGVTNVYGAGAFRVYRSLFRNSKDSDIKITNTGEFSFRDNTSINSNAFFRTGLTGNPACVTIQGNTILDPVGTVSPIEIRNQGPVLLLDNTIRSRVGFALPVVNFNISPSSDLFAMGNTFTVSNRYRVPNVRALAYDPPSVPRDSLARLTEPRLPGTPPNLRRRIFEVARNSGSAAIQTAINNADNYRGSRPVVHLPHGSYSITSTLIIPAGSDVQLVGDGYGDIRPTWLRWNGTAAGPVLQLAGRTKATLRDFSIYGNRTNVNILLSQVDQTGARIYLQQFNSRNNQRNILVNGLDDALVLAENCGFAKSTGTSVGVVGGVYSAQGKDRAGKTILFGGAESDNILSHEVTAGGTLLVRDVWYESNKSGQYVRVAGRARFTVEGSRIATPKTMPVPQMLVTQLNGDAVFVTSQFTNEIEVNGNGTYSRVLSVGNLTHRANFIRDLTSPAADIRSFNVRSRDPNTTISWSGSYQLPDRRPPSESRFTNMLALLRSTHAQVLTPLPEQTTDARVYRVMSTNSATGMELVSVKVPAITQASNPGLSESYQGSSTTFENVYPNPVKDIMTVTITAEKEEPLHLSLYDSKGSLVKKLETRLNPGSNFIKLNVQGLAKGSYTLLSVRGKHSLATQISKE
ncbi:glycosyl hydrolase family 28-related protein [Paraflavisolibacter sp. H34]|uniref:glycosyl hydrolase family 28-related protein n=1 Tax=Huijunlia imazamoxiresistens TaxID=3127457 RepID=UPI00301839BF